MFNKLLLLPALFLLSCTTKYTKLTGSPPCENVDTKELKGIVAELGLPAEKLKTKTGVFSLENGGESLLVRAWLCDHSTKFIDIQYYIFSRDNTGLIACDFLVRAANRGIKIRLLVDDATAKAGKHEIYALDSHENIEIKVYNPGVILGKLGLRLKKLFTEPNRFHRRMHVKSITVDGVASIIGGRNIADEYFDYDPKYNFRDRDVLLLGESVQTVKSSFEVYWNDKLSMPYTDLIYFKKKKKSRDPHRFDKLHAYACDEKNFSPAMRQKINNFPEDFKSIREKGQLVWLDRMSYVVDEPGKNERRKIKMGGATTDSLIALLHGAKRSVDIQSPYLVTTDMGKALFRDLVNRGVRVRILTNSLGATDNYEAFSGYQRDRAEMLATGVEIYEFKPDAKVRYKLMMSEFQAAMSYTPVYGLHSKSMIIDEYTSVIGSFNLDPRSANINTECVAILRSAEVAKILGEYINEEFLPENAWHITPDFNPDKEAGYNKRMKAVTRKIFPKSIL